MMMNVQRAVLTAVCSVGLMGSSWAQVVNSSEACGTLFSVGQYGPYDYRVDKDRLPIVLGAHFTREVEMLIRGKTSETPGGDIDYTLRAIPNNPRALIAMMRLTELEHAPRPKGAHYTMECYFERALRFRSDDNVVRMIYANYLTKSGRLDDAIKQLAYVESTADAEDPFSQNNLGLLYFEAGAYDRALSQAHKAQALGLPATELQNQLVRVGKWVDANAAAASASAAASTAIPPAPSSSPTSAKQNVGKQP